MANLARLREKNCRVVVTGQQAGLFGGPALTIYKAITAIQLAAELEKSGIPAVPVFWIASEDHDLAEVDHCLLPDSQSQLGVHRYPTQPEEVGRPVGKVFFSEKIREVLAGFTAAWPDSEFKPNLQSLLNRAYSEGASFGLAFGRLMAGLFEDSGLILLDPGDQELKELAAPLFQKILLQAEEVQQALTQRNQELKSLGFAPQVLFGENSFPLFLEKDGKRRALLREKGAFRLKGIEASYSPDQLLQWLRESPALFSTSALSRALYQDFLLPTVAYVGGPAEIAYFAQTSGLYRLFGETLPVLYPRASFTLIEKKTQKIFEKAGLAIEDLFTDAEQCLQKAVEENLDGQSMGVWVEAEEQIATILDNMEPVLRKVDPTLVEALGNSRTKILHQIESLRGRFVAAVARRDEILSRQLGKVRNLAYPDGKLQERQLNFCYFLSRYGPEILQLLGEEARQAKNGHRIIYL
jgi:bacillithiol biosynthesis cysteine-adding enzyme BshC